MKALFRGNIGKGMRLVGVYDNADCEKVAEYMAIAYPENQNLLDPSREFVQFLEIETRAIVNGYGTSEESERTLLAAGSLTRGLSTIGPYPNRNAALSNAVALNFGNKNTGYYAIEQDPEYEPLRKAIAQMLESYAALI